MLVALAFALLKAQQAGPVLAPLTSARFQNAVYSVEQSLQSKDFDAAKQKLQLLPHPGFTMVWDDTNVPAGYKAPYLKSAQDAVRMWNGRLPGLNATLVTKSQGPGEVKISFEPVLATAPDSKLPAVHVAFFSEDPATKQRLDFVIGLKRGNPLQATEEMDVFDDVAYCVGSYLGLADSPPEVGIMGSNELRRTERVTPTGVEHNAAKSNILVTGELTKAVNNHTAIAAGKPGLFLDPLVMESDQVIQGDRVEFHIQLSNRGDAPLSFTLFPDCGCSVVTPPGVVEPNSSRLVLVAVDTRMFSVNVAKHVFVYTNDPTTPVLRVTLDVKIKPRYRIVTPLGDTFLYTPGGMKVPIYLIPAPGTKINPVSTTVQWPGLTASATFAPWTGVLPGPDKKEGPIQTGYKFVLSLKGNPGNGRNPGSFQILTDDPDFPNITIELNTQKGIVALPEELYLNEIGHVPHTVEFIVSCPGLPYKVLDVTTNTKNLTATLLRSPDEGEYRIGVHYDGKAPSGQMIAEVRVHTTDKKQPYIVVPVRASIQ